MEMGKWRFILFQFSLIANFAISGCYGNQITYKHLPSSETEIKVDRIITLDNEVTKERSEVTGGGRSEVKKARSEVKGDHKQVFVIIQKLQQEIEDLKVERKKDRQTLSSVEEKLEEYHDEIIVSGAEVVQLRQLVTESYDRTNKLEDTAKDFSILTESFPYLEKDVTKELRRFNEYKERAAKRFHQIENAIKRLEKESEVTLSSVEKTTQGYISIQSDIASLRNLTHEIRDNVSMSFSLLSTCCSDSSPSSPVDDNQNHGIDGLHSKDRDIKGGNGNSEKLKSEVEITEFGSGDVYEYNLPIAEPEANTYKQVHLQHTVPSSTAEQTDQGSGEITHIFEGSGELNHVEGSGDAIDLPPFVDLSNYVHKTAFQIEISKREEIIQSLHEKFLNLTADMKQLEIRVTSIQLGDFMQRLQESFINFSQNVMTIDQFKTTSTQIVNSTLINQDSIVKLTNMILENTDKIADLRWKASNSELLSDQQFNILRMYVIRMNNSIEDLKEALKKLEDRKPMTGQQSSFYGNHAGYGAQYPYPGSSYGKNTQGNEQSLETLSSKLDHIGLQIVYNQNRIGNLEVKLLNESLYTCRKYNIDTYQDSQLAAQEAMIKANLESILMNHELLKHLDDAVNEIDQNQKSNARKLRIVTKNLNNFRGIIPAMLQMKREVDNFRFQLPTDCSEYYQRGYRKSGVYVIHPITADRSRQVTCHMEQDGGWTVIQQRFDGKVNFNQNWTEYRQGFGQPKSDYWLGADTIYLLASYQDCSLKIEMTDIYTNKWTATYDEFNVSHPDDNFSLTVSGYHGNATDNMEYSNGIAFSTSNRDNDASGTHCAFFYESGWWFKHCQLCNLNGRYDIGFMWFDLNARTWIPLKSSVMKIKPR